MGSQSQGAGVTTAGGVATEAPQGIDAAAVTQWYVDHIDGIVPPLSFTLVAGGHSNMTYRVDDAAGRATVLRRPPLGQVLATAHDMGREHRIISALGPTEVPVAPALGYEPGESVNGAPFYVMDFVDGRIVRTAAQAEALSVEGRRRAGESIADVLAAIHGIDPDAVGLGDLGRRDGYIERQLNRWYRQWNNSKTGDLADIDTVYEALSGRIPEQGPAAIVHGDYRLDNCMIDDGGNVIAVLDWELCTLGDPLADVGLLHVYWNEAGDRGAPVLDAATATEGFCTRRELFDRYAAASGRDLTHLPFYVAFGYWKLACIVEGVKARYAKGAMGSDRGGAQVVDAFDRQVKALAGRALATLDELG